ncbi:MAG TPA: rhodanese-like domain-containing protein [Acidimicrobiales bacterium]|nr:rhodanese-like domain-containing protein [Acidimicrobiales bacterium]
MPAVIGTDEALALHRSGALFVEVLGKKEYETAHVAGAVHVPLAKIGELGERGGPVVVYCFDFQ